MLLSGEPLPSTDSAWAMGQIMDGDATPAQIAGLAVGLRAKGETPAEVSGLVEAMLARAAPLSIPGALVDTCGTGGDRAATVNISTMAALVVAGTGAHVVKHGNRAASSACGSADLLESLGVVVALPPVAVARCVQEVGIGFCFAPLFHPAFRHTAVPRRELGVATVFNFLGPLTNPARVGAQSVGVSDARMAGVMAHVLADRGVSALLFRGDDGLDELTVMETSRIWEVRRGEVRETTFAPEDVGISRAAPGSLRGADPAHNADVTRALLAGSTGPVRDAVLLNAAAALVALDAAGPQEDGDPLIDRLREALGRAAAALDSGAAGDVLARWSRISVELADVP
jgi:anthranilate phosphoribosyltransferase